MADTYNRFRKLCGKGEIDLLEMSYVDARDVFKYYGIPVDGQDEAQIKAAYRKAMIKHHPDKGGDANIAKELNAAYDMIKKGDVEADTETVKEPTLADARKECQAIMEKCFNLSNVYSHSEVSVQSLDEAFVMALAAGRKAIGKNKWRRNDKMEEFFTKVANVLLRIRTLKPRKHDQYDWHQVAEKDLLSALMHVWQVGADMLPWTYFKDRY